MNYLTKKDIILPKRNPKSHKGDNGKLLIIGGSKDYVGAIALAGLAALRTGVDWVTIATLEKVGWAINCLTPDLVVKKLKSWNVNKLLTLEKDFSAVLIGNGINKQTWIKNYIKKSKRPLIIDADAIKSINLQDIDNALLTPHQGEFDILLKNSKLNKKNYKKQLKNNIILLKGKIDNIITKSKTLYNKTGNPGMTKAGTGDVLAGLAAGFKAQGLSNKQSAINASYINGALGDLQLKKKKGYFFIASDLLIDIKKVL
jgi:ADP-dependent NAD(P)H-hydrate dehydratase / NAD(P)H-hydrate epimerase